MLKAHRERNVALRAELIDAAIKKGPTERTRAHEVRDKLVVERQIRELDLQERQKQLTRVVEVQEAAALALNVLRSSFAAAVDKAADTLAAVTSRDAGLIRPHLQALADRAIDAHLRVLVDRNLMPAIGA